MPSGDFRMTHQRRIILQELRKTRSHPTADDIYMMVRSIIPRISLGTVYRNLEILSKKGFIRRIDFSGSQKRFDATVENHYHVKCNKCGKVEDVADDVITPVEFNPEKLSDYIILDHNVYLIGICGECQTA